MNDPDMIEEQELLQLFTRRRPDAARFAAGVAQRLLDHESGQHRRSRLSQAAAWLPLHLPGAKLWLWLSLPILLLAMPWIALFGASTTLRSSLRTTLRSDAAAPTSRWAHARFRVQSRLTAQQAGPLLGMLLACGMIVLPLFGWPHVLDTLLVASVVSMLALLRLVQRNVALGYGDREQVATICISLLQSLLVMALAITMIAHLGIEVGQWQGASMIVLTLGILALLPVAPLQSISTLLALGVLIGLMQLRANRGETDRPPTLAEVQAFCAKPDLAANDVRLSYYSSTIVALRHAGADVPVPDTVWRQLVQPILPDGPLDSAALTECGRAELIPASEWQRIAATDYRKRQLQQFLRQSGAINLPAYNEHIFRLLIARGLSELERTQLADRLNASWPDAAAPAALSMCRMLAAACDAIGRGDLAEQRRELVHTVVRRHQTLSGFDYGGFQHAIADNMIVPCDEIAMALIARFGLPPKLNVHALAAHLRHRSRASPSMLTTPGILRDSTYASFAQLLQLEAQLGEMPDRDILQVLLEERMLWSMLALVLLCLYAVHIAPPSVPRRNDDLATAMP